MLKLFFKSIAFIFGIAIIVLLVFNTCNIALCKNILYKTSNDTNLIVLGHSHTECSIDDKLIDGAINLSQSADTYFYTYFKLKKMVEANKSISKVMLVYTNNMLSQDRDNWIYTGQYLSSKLPKYAHLLQAKDWYVIFRHGQPGNVANTLLKIFQNNLYSCIANNNSQLYKEFKWGGYLFLVRDSIPKEIFLYKEMATKEYNVTINNKSATSTNIKYLVKIAEYCKQNNLKLILIRPPLFSLYDKYYDSELHNMLNNELAGIEFIDYSNCKLKDDEFGDFEHLNYRGANAFTKILLHYIKCKYL